MGDDLEEYYFGKRKKAERKNRRVAQERDRSKYKKTDREKWLIGVDQEMQMKMEKRVLFLGRVLSVVPQGFVVDYEGNRFICTLRGLLKKEKRQLKNVVTVGDFVQFERSSEGEGVIFYVEPRTSILSRQDAMTRKNEHLLAANIDQVLITASVVNPPLKPSLIDRYIIAARKGNMVPIVVINKIDLLSDPQNEAEREVYERVVHAYISSGIVVVAVSAKKKGSLDQLFAVMKNRSSVFSGQSGSGKSSLINEVTGLHLPVGKVVEKTRKGAHTTTRAHLIPLEFGGFCVDTPGIKSFGIWGLQKSEIENYYTEIFQIGRGCKFPNCTHIHEESCAVLEAVEKGVISPFRYESYAQLFLTIDKEHIKR